MFQLFRLPSRLARLAGLAAIVIASAAAGTAAATRTSAAEAAATAVIGFGSGPRRLRGTRRSAQPARQSCRLQKRSGPETELDPLFPYAVEPGFVTVSC